MCTRDWSMPAMPLYFRQQPHLSHILLEWRSFYNNTEPGPVAQKAIEKDYNLLYWSKIIYRNQYSPKTHLDNNYKTIYDTNHILAATSHKAVIFQGTD